jgi:hypothetical protein
MLGWMDESIDRLGWLQDWIGCAIGWAAVRWRISIHCGVASE